MMAAASEVTESPKDIFSMFNNADLRFPKITGGKRRGYRSDAWTVLSPFCKVQDRRVRRDAFRSLYGMYHQYRNTLAAVYRANVKQEVFRARVRKYGSDLEAALDGSHIPVSVYENLIEAVHEALPFLHRYVRPAPQTFEDR